MESGGSRVDQPSGERARMLGERDRESACVCERERRAPLNRVYGLEVGIESVQGEKCRGVGFRTGAPSGVDGGLHRQAAMCVCERERHRESVFVYVRDFERGCETVCV